MCVRLKGSAFNVYTYSKLATVASHAATLINDGDGGQVVPLPALVVVVIVGGGDLHST